MNVGGLNRNSVIAHALVPAKFPRRWSEIVSCLRTELFDFRANCTFLPTAENGGAGMDRRSERKPALPLYTPFCVGVKEAAK